MRKVKRTCKAHGDERRSDTNLATVLRKRILNKEYRYLWKVIMTVNKLLTIHKVHQEAHDIEYGGNLQATYSLQ